MGFESMGNRRVTAYRGKNLTIQFEMDRDGIRKCAVGPELRAAVTSIVVDRAKPYAIGISPYDPKAKGGHYRDAFVVTQGYVTIAGLRRVAARLFNVSDHSTEVEWKNGSRVLGHTLGYLNHNSVLAEILRGAEQKAARKQAPFNAALHPRGARGRFTPKSGSGQN